MTIGFLDLSPTSKSMQEFPSLKSQNFTLPLKLLNEEGSPYLSTRDQWSRDAGEKEKPFRVIISQSFLFPFQCSLEHINE